MTLSSPAVLQNLTYSAEQLRMLNRHYAQAGVLGTNDLKVTQRGAGANMSVDVAIGYVVIQFPTATHERAVCYNSAAYNVAITTAPGGGNSRIDLIVADLQATEYGDGSDVWRIRSIDGTPGSSPSAPATPSGCVPLAQVTVGASVTSISTANCADVRPYAGWVTYADRRPTVATNGQIIIDSNDVIWTYSAGAWDFAPHRSQMGGVSDEIATKASPQTLTGTATAYGTITFTQPTPTGRVAITAKFAGSILCASGTNAVAEYSMEVSVDGGSTWVTRQYLQATSSTVSTASAMAFTMMVRDTPTGSIKARVKAKNASGSGKFWGEITMTVAPVV